MSQADKSLIKNACEMPDQTNQVSKCFGPKSAIMLSAIKASLWNLVGYLCAMALIWG
tara:strand:+ start:2173 stop:2343 length:171 start_codon:yes stop_codon:yes gene_type:complete